MKLRIDPWDPEGGVEAPALAGSWAVGCAWSTRPPRIGEVHVGRELVPGVISRVPLLAERVRAGIEVQKSEGRSRILQTARRRRRAPRSCPAVSRRRSRG